MNRLKLLRSIEENIFNNYWQKPPNCVAILAFFTSIWQQMFHTNGRIAGSFKLLTCTNLTCKHGLLWIKLKTWKSQSLKAKIWKEKYKSFKAQISKAQKYGVLWIWIWFGKNKDIILKNLCNMLFYGISKFISTN